MSRSTSILIVFLAGIQALAHLTTAPASELRSSNQLPDMIEQDSDKITITNIGTADLNILYLEESWKPIQVPSGKYVKIPSQSTGLSISFSDGVETKSVTLSRGTTYALHWNAVARRWAIAPYDEVARRPSGLRSR